MTKKYNVWRLPYNVALSGTCRQTGQQTTQGENIIIIGAEYTAKAITEMFGTATPYAGDDYVADWEIIDPEKLPGLDKDNYYDYLKDRSEEGPCQWETFMEWQMDHTTGECLFEFGAEFDIEELLDEDEYPTYNSYLEKVIEREACARTQDQWFAFSAARDEWISRTLYLYGNDHLYANIQAGIEAWESGDYTEDDLVEMEMATKSMPDFVWVSTEVYC